MTGDNQLPGLLGLPGPGYPLERILAAVSAAVHENATQIVAPENFDIWSHLHKLLTAVIDATDCEFAFIAQPMLGNDGQSLRVLAWEDTRWTAEQRLQVYDPAGKIREIEFGDSDSFYAEVQRTKAPVITNDAPNDPRYAHHETEGALEVRSFCGLPILTKGRLVGMLCLGNRSGGFTGNEATELELFVDLVTSSYTMGARFLTTQKLMSEQISINSIAKQTNIWFRSDTLWPKLAHDLNGIFAIVAMQTELIRIKLDDREAVIRGLDRIDGAVTKLSQYTTQLDILGRLSGNENSPAPVVDNCRGLVFAAQLSAPPGVKVSVTSDLLEEAWVNMTTTQLQVVINSVLTNAIEAVGETGAVIVDILSPDPGHVIIQVTDTGPGIDPSVKEGLFGRPVTTKAGPDRGYGLMAVKTLVDRAIGEVSLEHSAIGTRVRILLPTMSDVTV